MGKLENLSTYALKDGKIVYIDEVSKGLDCNCICPSCQARMIAKHGNVRKHHFAHYKAQPCASGFQTAVHIRAKEILSKLKYICVPEYIFTFYKRQFHIPKMMIKIKKVELEKRYRISFQIL